MISENQKEAFLDMWAESPETYIEMLVEEKALHDSLGWQDIADLVQEKFGIYKSRHYYYRNYGDSLEARRVSINNESIEKPQPSYGGSSYENKLLEMQKERIKLSDERAQNKAYIRRIARDETIKEIIGEAVKTISKTKMLPVYVHNTLKNKDKEALLILSDWHYGMDISIPWNKYNPEIARERISRLLAETIQYCESNDISNITVLNLSDLIAGRIHLTIRLESRIDVITQIMEVSEILSEFLNELSNHFNVSYYSCDDNHSRLEPDKTQSIDVESLCRITDWYLRERLGDRVEFHDNKFGNGIITLNILGHNIAGVHGHRDKPQSAIEDISLMTRNSYDLICMAHLHHFSMDEKCGCRVIGAPSLIGTDNFSSNLRLYSKPSQVLVVVSKDRVCEDIHIIELE